MIQITEQAAVQIKRIAAERGTLEGGLRVGVKGGGCSGLSYVMDWAPKPNANDKRSLNSSTNPNHEFEGLYGACAELEEEPSKRRQHFSKFT